MIKIGVVFGSPSDEHEVSLAGAESILNAFKQLDQYEAMPIGIDKNGNWYTGEHALSTLISQANQDLLFVDQPIRRLISKTSEQLTPPLAYINSCDYIMLVIPGRYGEDGRLQGFFETLGKKNIGCGVLSSALCFDKAMLKAVLSDYGYDVTPGTDVFLKTTDITSELFEHICNSLGTHRLVLKPTDNGSSIGLSQAENFEEFKAGMIEAGKYTDHVVVEKFIPHKEIVVGVIGNGDELLISELGLSNETADRVYGYQEKYIDTSPCIVPAPIDETLTAKIKALTAEIYQLTKCSGWARVDFLIEDGTNNIYVNEVNTIPGMSKPSVFPTIFAETGLSYPEMLERIFETSITEFLRQAA